MKHPLLTSLVIGLSVLSGAAGVSGNAQAQSGTPSAQPLEPAQVEAIEKVVREYLLENPEVLIEALNIYETRRREAEQAQQRRAIVENLDALHNDPDSPSLGNPDGDVVLVEFFDYRCPYCKVTAPRIQHLLATDPGLRVVMKELPILSEESVGAARAALAAAKQGRYEAFHFALMEQPGDLKEDHLRAIAERSGVDPDRMIEDMHSEEIEQALDRNHDLARVLGISGTPAMIIGENLIPGAAKLDEMQRMITAARSQ